MTDPWAARIVAPHGSIAATLTERWPFAARARLPPVRIAPSTVSRKCRHAASAAPARAFRSFVPVSVSQPDETGVGVPIGTLTLQDTKSGLKVTPHLAGLPPGEHGFHVHANGACGVADQNGKPMPGLAAGGHFDSRAALGPGRIQMGQRRRGSEQRRRKTNGHKKARKDTKRKAKTEADQQILIRLLSFLFVSFRAFCGYYCAGAGLGPLSSGHNSQRR